jgi:hypothetical protein
MSIIISANQHNHSNSLASADVVANDGEDQEWSAAEGDENIKHERDED